METRCKQPVRDGRVIGEVHTGNRLMYSGSKRNPVINSLQAGSYNVVDTLKLADGTTCYVTDQLGGAGDTPLIIPEQFVDSVKIYPETVEHKPDEITARFLSSDIEPSNHLRRMDVSAQERIKKAIRVLQIDLANGHDISKAIANISRIMKLTSRECLVFRSMARRVAYPLNNAWRA